MIEFLQMGGYAPFLWPSFGLFFGLLLWQALAARSRHRRALQVVSGAPQEGRS